MTVDVQQGKGDNLIMDYQDQSTLVAASKQSNSVQNNEFLHTELLATLSHELRSPLAAIKGYVTTLLRLGKQLSDQERTEFLLAIDQGSNRLAYSIDQLLELAQLEAGMVTLQPAALNLMQLLQAAIACSTVQQPIEQAKQPEHPRIIRLRQENCLGGSYDEDIIIQADRQYLLTAFAHLLDNACNHSPDDSPIDVIVSPICTEEDRKHLPLDHSFAKEHDAVVIRVRDYGVGIPGDQLERIFQRFQHTDMQLTRKVNGLGLGLTISRHIIALHQGSIWAESEPGIGTTIHVLLSAAGI
jgi:signal transduction histidine kinase